MSGLNDTNIVVSQGNRIEEVYNVKRDKLELNQQYVAQQTEKRKKENKDKLEKSKKVAVKGKDDKKGNVGGGNDNSRENKKSEERETAFPNEKSLIDIKV